MSSQTDFLEEARVIEREGITPLLKYLNTTDFYDAPASTKFHGCHEKGLVIHSLTVHDIMKEMNEMLDLKLDKESIAICGLFHDVCKANFYVKEMRNKKIDGKWHEVEEWGVKDQLPMGHGEKSVYILMKYMILTDAEALAIRWHLGGFDPGVHFMYPSGAPQKQTFRENKLATLLVVSDMSASYLVDSWG
jgi:hypothetical protein